MKGKELGRKGLESITTLFTPDTILPLASPVRGPEVGLQQPP